MSEPEPVFLVGFTETGVPIHRGPYRPDAVDERIEGRAFLLEECGCTDVYVVTAHDQTDAVRQANQERGTTRTQRHKADDHPLRDPWR